MAESRKSCPGCAGAVEAGAQRCRKCGYDFAMSVGRSISPISEKAKRFGCLKIVGFIVLAFCVFDFVKHLMGLS